MDVCGVAREESAAFAEMLGDPVMHVIGRKPVDLRDRHLHLLDRASSDVVERQRIGAVRALVAHRSDQSRTSLSR